MAQRGNPNWVKNGASPNPGGRPALANELRARALKVVDAKVFAAWEDEVTERPREIMTMGGPVTMTCKGPNWVKCSELLAAYGLGKPIQPVESKIEMEVRDTRQMTREQIVARIAELEGKHVEH